MLSEVTKPDGERVRFEYDAFARRTAKRVVEVAADGTETVQAEHRFVWDGHTVLHELDSNRGLTTWYWEPQTFTPVAKEQGGRKWSVASDHLGTPTEMYDELGQLAWKMQLDVFGVPEFEAGGAEDCPWRWPGQYEDAETGDYYNRWRYYGDGAYRSRDPLGLASGVCNLNQYVEDPTFVIDPLGLDWNYILVDASGTAYYDGRAAEGASMRDVARRHAANTGPTGTSPARFGPGDTMHRITPVTTDYGAVRGVEQRGAESRPLLGRGSTDVRGNLISGMSEARQATPVGVARLEAADALLDGRPTSDMPRLESLTHVKFKAGCK